MSRLVLMRHAEQELGPDDDPSQPFSAGDRELSERGRRQARAARDRLADAGFDGVYASPLLRARRTAEIVADPHDLDVRIDDRLVELPFVGPETLDYETVMDGIRSLAEALEAGDDPEMAGGVRYSAVRARIVEGLAEVLDRCERPLVVAHGGVNRLVLTRALGLPDRRMFELGQDHACINVLEGDADALRVVRMNERPGVRGKA